MSAAPHHCGDRGRSSRRRRRRMSRRRIPKVGSRPPQSGELAWRPFLKKIKISLSNPETRTAQIMKKQENLRFF